ncbi:sensor histidine kinase [Leptolyngbya sp. FACHB-261]|uniref:sensor histidine kinase n=1 Tax=Leptolyngbya sp. FACHB-261 TaxID=2692806 RepID=UPI001687C4C8|nr:ATP-binding protein [Leptolyngbya sp. FACHB-261]MBD2099791.1 hypothetical protein [Leptolyngbya sp. FACHB-261]
MSLQIEVLEQSFQWIKPQAADFVACFYRTLFVEYPQVQALFACTDMEQQNRKLWISLELVIENLRKPDVLAGALRGLGARHTQYGVIDDHYAMIGTVLLKTLAVFLAERWTDTLAQAWDEAYQVVLNLMQQGDHDLKQSQVQLIQVEKMASLGKTVAGIAHEINNPVGFIYGNLIHTNQAVQELLELVQLYQAHYPEPVAEIEAKLTEIDFEFLSEDLPKTLQSMQRGTERIRRLVNTLKNFSRLDEATTKLTDLHQGLDQTLLLLQYRLQDGAGEPLIWVVREYDKLPLVDCDARQLNQVFMNILSNAIDALEMFNPEPNRDEPRRAQITIRTSWLKAQPNQQTNWIQVSIADNGPGIANAVKPHIFDPFFTTKPVGQGTGLGLSISYQIVRQHGGQLKCLSSPGQGAEFVIEIPVQPVEA